jgi:hypothetical protein
MFDMRNFGDLLFPLMAAFRLGKLGIEVVPVAPTAGKTGFIDAIDSTDIREMICGECPVDAILVGGGYIIHNHDMGLLEEYRDGDLASWAGAGLWLGAGLAAALRDIPIVWNAPGVPHPFGESLRPVVAAALRATDYVSVRDKGSAELLAAPEDIDVHVIPDPIAELARLWPASELEVAFKTFLARNGMDPAAKCLALHFRNRSLAGAGSWAAAAWIAEFADASGLMPVLIGIGQSHHDHILAREIGAHLAIPHVLFDDPSSLKEVAAVIANSLLYIGASLHGYIAAQAYGVPGVLVAKPAYRKFRGFLDHTGETNDLVRDWPEAFARGAEYLSAFRRRAMPESVFRALDAHWGRIAGALGDQPKRSRERRSFLRFYANAGFEVGGGRWVHQPFTAVNRKR